MRYIKIFRCNTPSEIENQINDYVKQKKAHIISINVIINQGLFYATVLFEEKEPSAKKAKTEKL